MKSGRTSLLTRLQSVVAVVVLALLWAPMAAHAKSDQKAKQSVSKTSVSKSAQREKRIVQHSKSSVAKRKPDKRSALASKDSKPKAKRTAQTAKTNKNPGLAKVAKGQRTARLTGGREIERNSVSARKDRGKKPFRAVARHKGSHVVHVASAPRLSIGERMGLRSSADPLDLNSSVAFVIDQQTNEVLFSKNQATVLPIASLTKLMTGLVITEANLPMDEIITITKADVDTIKRSSSRLAVGTALTRGELMHLALMSSENRAAHALGRTYPGGIRNFVRIMNAKASELGMADTRYVEPTGLSSLNQSSARDLATLVSVAYESPILRSLSTSPSHQLDVGQRTLEYRNSNRLIRDPHWDIGLQKTGYISEAGRCLVMQAKVAGRQLIMVFLDSTGKLSRSQDAERVRRWVEAQSYLQPLARPQG